MERRSVSGRELEDMEIYVLACQIEDRIWQIASTWPMFAKDTVGKQLIRAADSIGANIAEGYGRFHYSDKVNFFYYARGSLYETRHFVRIARARNLVDEGSYRVLLGQLELLAPKLNAFISQKKAQKQNAK